MPRFILLLLCAILAAGAHAFTPVYHSLDSMPVLGTLAPRAAKHYSRLPDELKDSLRPDLWALGLNSAGLAVRFRTDAANIRLRWTSLNKFNMNHMTPTGIRGLDLYALTPEGEWTTVSSARPSLANRTSTSTIVTDMAPVMREYMLYLSLYDGVDSISIGVDSAAVVLPPAAPLPLRDAPVVMYGTSILQGGCATRPGMAHTNILQRLLGREVVNLGFSGNARLDPEIARLMGSAPASVYVIDCLPNCTEQMLRERLVPFYQILRERQPKAQILFVESPDFPIMRFSLEVDSTINSKNAALRDIYAGIAAADSRVGLFPASEILGDDVEATVDNYHFTDYGFQRFAEAMLPTLRRMIEQYQLDNKK